MAVSDNGTGLTSTAILKWHEDRKVEWHQIAPRKPYAEWLGEKLQRQLQERVSQRDTVLSTGRNQIIPWAKGCNRRGPHSWPGNLAPSACAMNSAREKQAAFVHKTPHGFFTRPKKTQA